MNTTRCRHLRTKKLFIVAQPDEAFTEKESEHATPAHYWCNLTQTVVGPDDGIVCLASCLSGRSCCEP